MCFSHLAWPYQWELSWGSELRVRREVWGYLIAGPGKKTNTWCLTSNLNRKWQSQHFARCLCELPLCLPSNTVWTVFSMTGSNSNLRNDQLHRVATFSSISMQQLVRPNSTITVYLYRVFFNIYFWIHACVARRCQWSTVKRSPAPPRKRITSCDDV